MTFFYQPRLSFVTSCFANKVSWKVEHNRGGWDRLGRRCSRSCESFSFNHVGKILWACGMMHKGRQNFACCGGAVHLLRTFSWLPWSGANFC